MYLFWIWILYWIETWRFDFVSKPRSFFFWSDHWNPEESNSEIPEIAVRRPASIVVASEPMPESGGFGVTGWVAQTLTSRLIFYWLLYQQNTLGHSGIWPCPTRQRSGVRPFVDLFCSEIISEIISLSDFTRFGNRVWICFGLRLIMDPLGSDWMSDSDPV